MTTLIEQIVEAAGGEAEWAGIAELGVEFELGGAIWAQLGQADVVGHISATVSAHEQRVAYRSFGEAAAGAEYTPSEVLLRYKDGTPDERRTKPRVAIVGRGGPPWDRLDTAYFAGYALWNYLNVPFLFLRPDVGVVEVEPWTETSSHTLGRPEEWRRLEVTFPEAIATHNRTQVFYYDADGRQRRHDYAADVFGGAPTAHYSERHREFGGLVLPTRRRVVPLDARTWNTEDTPVLVSLDLIAVELR